MRFQKGNKAGQGGLRNPPGGRPTKEQQEIKKAAAEIARDYIERSVKPVMHTYFQLAHGRLVNKWHEGQIAGQEFEAAPATTRHCVNKILPAEQMESAQPIQINFIQFGRDRSFGKDPVSVTAAAPYQLPPPPPTAEEKTEHPQGINFRDFSDVHRRRRE